MLNVDELPYLTADLEGIGGTIKSQPEDFVVEEVPLYEPSGEGTHVYFKIEKTSLATMRAMQDIARALGRPARDIGFAGLKDADAVTTQMLSIEHIDPAQVESLSIPRIRVLNVALHTNKLKLGHLKGNRFIIKLRNADISRLDDVRSTLDTLAERGVPNYFGPQRFGMRGDTWQIGQALLRQDYEEAVTIMLGCTGPLDYGQVRIARELFDTGDYAAAAEAWPNPFRDERRLCRILAKNKANFKRAFGAVDKRLRRLFISAYQSQLFNQIVAQRIGSLDRLKAGDLAWRHPQGAVFAVEDVEIEQPRCDAFEISPTGPLFGRRMSQPSGETGEIEQSLLAETNLTLDDWQDGPHFKVRGGRRPLRFQPQGVSVENDKDDAGPYLQLRFFLESGCYATTVLRELCKSHKSQQGEEAE